MIADIIVDLQYGDCGKGKVAHHLCRMGYYTHVIPMLLGIMVAVMQDIPFIMKERSL